MIRFGVMTEGHVLDENGSTVEYVASYKEFSIRTQFKRFSHRVWVHNPKEEMQEYINWTKEVQDARDKGTLVRGDNDPGMRPTFEVVFPKHDRDHSYFVIRSHTEIVEN